MFFPTNKYPAAASFVARAVTPHTLSFLQPAATAPSPLMAGGKGTATGLCPAKPISRAYQGFKLCMGAVLARCSGQDRRLHRGLSPAPIAAPCISIKLFKFLPGLNLEMGLAPGC